MTDLERKIIELLDSVHLNGYHALQGMEIDEATTAILSLFQDEVKGLVEALEYIKFCQQTSHL